MASLSQIIDTSKKFLKDNLNPEAVYLFGSQASGETHAQSDIDLAILLKQPLNPERIWTLQSKLAVKIKMDVNLIDLRSATTVFQYEILTTGKSIMINNDSFTGQFEDRVYQLYITLNEDRKEILDEILKSGKVYD